MENREKKAYIMILTSVSYLKGVQVTYRSLRCYTDMPVIVLISDDITDAVAAKLEAEGMLVRRADKVEVSETCLNRKMLKDRWYSTLFKLRVFGMTEYDFLVYLDSDLLICANIDELFEKEHMSAVSDFDFFPQYGRGGLNAGVMCIKPSKLLEEDLIEQIEKVAAKMDIFGDQDVINELYDSWDNDSSKHLGVEYNACFYELDNYRSVIPKVIHFILGDKPWMWSRRDVFLKKVKWILTGKTKRIFFLNQYIKILREVI